MERWYVNTHVSPDFLTNALEDGQINLMLQNARQLYNIAKETSNEIVYNRDSDSEGAKTEPEQKTMSWMLSDITKNASQISTADMLQDLTKVDILRLRFRVLMLI